MTRAWRLRAAPVAMLLVAACQDAPTTPLEHPDEGGGGLSFLMPDIEPSMLVIRSIGEEAEPSTGPARVIEEGEEAPLPEYDGSYTAPASDIWNERTRVGFDPGSAWAVGDHDYQGNKSDITTTVTVSLDGVEIGQQSAYTLQNMLFLVDFGLPRHIQAITRAFVNQECGLFARGDSQHAAWWEPVPGLKITDLARTGKTSYSLEPARQPDCAPPEPSTDGGGGGGGYDEGSGGYCWVEIWYDMETGEVIDWQVLSCDPYLGG